MGPGLLLDFAVNFRHRSEPEEMEVEDRLRGGKLAQQMANPQPGRAGRGLFRQVKLWCD